MERQRYFDLVREKDCEAGVEGKAIVANPKLATLAAVSSLVVVFALGYLVQGFMSPNGVNLSGARWFWLTFVAGPLAVATFLGVLLSRQEGPLFFSAVVISVAPLVAFFTFLAAYLGCFAVYSGHYTPVAVDSILTITHASAIVTVRWFVSLTHRLKKI